MPRRVYKNAPIVEAVIDIRVTQQQATQLPADSALADDLKAFFPQRQPVHRVNMGVGQAPDGSISETKADHHQAGWKLFNESKDRILQLHELGFTYSHMPPYTRWEIFRTEAHELWQKYLATHAAKRVTRLATRYINRLRLPPGAIELGEFLAMHPALPKSFDHISNVVMQVQMPPEALEGVGQAVISIASEVVTDPSFQPIVLDIDLFREVDMEPADPAIWVMLDSMRDKKNQLFEAAVTDRMKELFA